MQGEVKTVSGTPPSHPFLFTPPPPHVVMEADMSWAAAAAGGIPAGRFCLEQRHSGSV